MITLAMIFGPGLLGGALLMLSGKCRGRNGRACVRFAGWGFLLMYLTYIPVIPIAFINTIVMLAPSAICFLLAFNAIVREMRAQKNGEFTEAA